MVFISLGKENLWILESHIYYNFLDWTGVAINKMNRKLCISDVSKPLIEKDT